MAREIRAAVRKKASRPKNSLLEAREEQLTREVTSIYRIAGENIIATTDDGLTIAQGRPREIDPRIIVILIGGPQISSFWKPRISLILDLAWQSGQFVDTIRAESTHRLITRPRPFIEIPAETKIQAEIRGDAKIVLKISSPVTPAYVETRQYTGVVAATIVGRSQQELSQPRSPTLPRNRVRSDVPPKSQACRIGAAPVRMLQPINKPGLQGVFANDFGDVVENGVGF